MRVLLVQPYPYYASGATGIRYPPVGLLYNAAVLERAGHEVSVLDCNLLGWPASAAVEEARRGRAELIGIYANIVSQRAALEMARSMRAALPEARIVFGGPMPSTLPEAFLPWGDVVVRGEGEEAVVEVASALESRHPERALGAVAGIHFRAGGEARANPDRRTALDLDRLPLPAYHLLRPALAEYSRRARLVKAYMAPLFTSRGCPFQCTYCNKSVFGSQFRPRSAASVVAEVEWLHREFGVHQIDILDDNFSFDLERAEAILDGIISLNLGLAINGQNGLRADRITPSFVAKLKAAGVFKVGIGIESGDPRVLEMCRKKLDLDRVVEALRLLRRAGITVHGQFILGLFGDTAESMQRTIDFAHQANPHFANFTTCVPFPGTAIYGQVLRAGRLLVDVAHGIDSGFFDGRVFFETPEMPADEVLKAYRRAFASFYFRPGKLLDVLLHGIHSWRELRWVAATALSVLPSLIGPRRGRRSGESRRPPAEARAQPVGSGRVMFVRFSPFYCLELAHPQQALVPLDLGLAATMLSREGRAVALIDTWSERVTPEDIEARATAFLRGGPGPRVLAVDAATASLPSARSLIQKIRAAGAADFAVGYGPHATCLPESLLGTPTSPVADGCVIGEPEQVLVDLLEALEGRRRLDDVSGLTWWRSRDGVERSLVANAEREPLTDLDRLPFVNYGLFDLSRYRVSNVHVPRFRARWAPIMTSRGCPYGCTFCSPISRKSYGRKVRFHSARYVADNIAYLEREFGVNAVLMVDDLFTLDRDRVHELCDLLVARRSRVVWAAQTRADALDEDLVRHMREAGCRAMCLGVESGSERVLRQLNKGETLEDIRRAVRLLHRHRLAVTLFFILGNPGETYEEALASIQLARELKPLIVQVSYLTPYPGSRIYEDLRRRDGEILGEGQLELFSHYNFIACNLSAMTTEQLAMLQRRFYAAFYLSPGYIGRYLVHRLPYRLLGGEDLALIGQTLRFLVQKRSYQRGEGARSHAQPRVIQ